MRVNGTEVSLDRPFTLAEYLEASGYVRDRVAAELNGRIVPRSRYDDTVLADEDSIEIVGFVGGG
ncbi:MAG: sulfur carrier protein ThiS [Candidatus Methanoplasma sp.]|jgi:thiamine biosynthesis protein ThiS|nr:sulfur carrier protein ThiS [Candidatus Methanoplasma sp.]